MGFVAPVLAMVGVSAGTATTIGTIASIAATGLSVVGNLMGMSAAQRQASSALALQQQQLTLARSSAELQAAQQSAERTRRYSDVISSQTAIWAARGVQLNSGVVRAVADASGEAYERDLRTIELNRINRLASLALQGADYEQAAAVATQNARTRALLGIGTSLFELGSNLARQGYVPGASNPAPSGGGSGTSSGSAP